MKKIYTQTDFNGVVLKNVIGPSLVDYRVYLKNGLITEDNRPLYEYHTVHTMRNRFRHNKGGHRRGKAEARDGRRAEDGDRGAVQCEEDNELRRLLRKVRYH
jgi:hypothetical protein